jgi:hypothetical protein
LKPEGTFEAQYVINCSDDYKGIKFSGTGNFVYSPTERKLTLNADEIKQVDTCFRGDENFEKGYIANKESLDKLVDSTFKKTEINNYFWAASSINYPWITFGKKSEASNEYDFEDAFVDTLQMRCDDYDNIEFKRIMQNIDLAVSKSNGRIFATTITEPMSYDYDTLVLYPDGTFKYKNVNDTWDPESPISWDSSLVCTGKWVYDTTNGLMTLFYENYKIIDDGKEMDNTRKNLPKIHETKDFYFEADYIKTLSVEWINSSLYGITSKLISNKK